MGVESALANKVRRLCSNIVQCDQSAASDELGVPGRDPLSLNPHLTRERLDQSPSEFKLSRVELLEAFFSLLSLLPEPTETCPEL